MVSKHILKVFLSVFNLYTENRTFSTFALAALVFFYETINSKDINSFLNWTKSKPKGFLFHVVFLLSIAAAKSRQSCPTLCDPTDGSLPGSAVPGILQARTLKWVAISFSSAWKWKVKVKSLRRVRLSDPMDWSLPGSSVHGIFQARVLKWAAIAFSILSIK